MAWYELVSSRDGSVREHDAELDALRDVAAIVCESGEPALADWELDLAEDDTHVTRLARGTELAVRAAQRVPPQRCSA